MIHDVLTLAAQDDSEDYDTGECDALRAPPRSLPVRDLQASSTPDCISMDVGEPLTEVIVESCDRSTLTAPGLLSQPLNFSQFRVIKVN